MPSELPRQSGQLNINIEDGVDFQLSCIFKINGTPVDVTGYTATFTLYDGSGQPGVSLLELTEASGVTVGTSDGSFVIDITETQAAFGNLPMTYDFIITSPGGNEKRILRGVCQSHASGTP